MLGERERDREYERKRENKDTKKERGEGFFSESSETPFFSVYI